MLHSLPAALQLQWHAYSPCAAPCQLLAYATFDVRKLIAYKAPMIRSFKNKALADLFQTGKTAKIDAKMHKRILVRLDRLEAAERPEDMNLPGFNFHALNGFDPTRYSVHVNGPCCITFEFEGKDATRVDFEQYH